jgi:hypothetical protein
VLPPAVTIFIIIRLFSRIKLDIGLGPDDYTAIMAYLSYMADVGTGINIATHGFGQHTFWLSNIQMNKSLMVGSPLYPVLLFAKLIFL